MSDWSVRAYREKAKNQKLAILHSNGSVGYVTSVSAWEAHVKFPEWKGAAGGSKHECYQQGSASLTILSVTYEDYIAQGGAGQMTTQALYEVTLEEGSKKFATKIMEKNKTLWVMEIKGGDNTYVAVSTDKIVEVVPYTIKVCPVGMQQQHFEAPEGKFAVNDLLLLKNGVIATVLALDTKIKGAPEINAVGKINVTPL
jgi:hypothetical protein